MAAPPGCQAGAQGIAQGHGQVAQPALMADAADRAALGAAQKLGFVPGQQLHQAARQAGARVEVRQRWRWANLFQGQTSWQSSQP
jgi:hypothetical protein